METGRSSQSQSLPRDGNGTFLSLALPCETAIRVVTGCLNAQGMKVVRSFDLRSACATFPDNVCPHHGTSPCDCQLVVLLVYGKQPGPASLVMHGHRMQTEIQLAVSPEMKTAPGLISGIYEALEVEATVKAPDSRSTDGSG